MSRPKHEVNLWIVPLKVSCGATLLFAATMTPDLLAAHHIIHLPDWFTMGGIDDARAILAAMLGCVSTVLALIFSVTLLVLSMVANLFGPRLLYRFVQDWVTQICIGLFMGAFIYVFLVFLVTHGDQQSTFVPQVSLITSWLVVLGAFAFLVFYSHRVALLIQNPDAIGRIVDDLGRAIKATQSLQPHAEGQPSGDHEGGERDWINHFEIVSRTSGYIQLIDFPRLIKIAAGYDGFVTLHLRPGQFVLAGEILGTVSAIIDHENFANQARQTIVAGRHRVLQQDFEFGLAQIVEIAIRALSPAVNDTFTGVACVDLLGEALLLLYDTPGNGGRWFDSHGVYRVQVRPLLLSRLVRQAFDQIRQAAAENPAVSLRLLSTITRLGSRIEDLPVQQSLQQEADAIWETVNLKPLARIDHDEIQAAWRLARAFGQPKAEAVIG